MDYKGRITISRVSCSGDRGDYIKIELEDEASSCRVVVIDVPIKEFGALITGRSYMPCKFELYKNSPIGKKREIKTELIKIKKEDYYQRGKGKEFTDNLVKDYLVDGWKLNHWQDVYNHHRIKKYSEADVEISVTFVRFVDGNSKIENPEGQGLPKESDGKIQGDL